MRIKRQNDKLTLDRRLEILLRRGVLTATQEIDRNRLKNHDVLSRKDTAVFEEESDEDKYVEFDIRDKK